MSESKEYSGPIVYVVATPIGNLRDITLRALDVFKTADFILCEDTRTTGVLLHAHGISAHMASYNAHATPEKVEYILEQLQAGKRIALVSDAGTPGISDPGAHLIAQIRQRAPDVPVVAIPGASALTAALSIFGMPVSDFLFLGFLPHKKGRQTLFAEMLQSERTVVFYESPHRILKTLESLKELGCTKRICIGRELTKFFEEVIEGTVEEVISYFAEHPDKVRGEFVVAVGETAFRSDDTCDTIDTLTS